MTIRQRGIPYAVTAGNFTSCLGFDREGGERGDTTSLSSLEHLEHRTYYSLVVSMCRGHTVRSEEGEIYFCLAALHTATVLEQLLGG